MSLTVTIQDFTNVGKISNKVDVSFRHETVTLKDIIEARVIKEVTDYNNKTPDYFNGLVQPSGAEQTLNGYRMKERRRIDPEKQVYIALDAFLKNGYFVMIDNKQVESLEQEITLRSNTDIRFMKLTPLVGG